MLHVFRARDVKYKTESNATYPLLDSTVKNPLIGNRESVKLKRAVLI